MIYGQEINIRLGSTIFTLDFYDEGTELIAVGKVNEKEIVGKVSHSPLTHQVQYDKDHTFVEMDGNQWVLNNESIVR
jgi:hypothetical protein